MSVNRDPNSIPSMPEGMREEAQATGRIIVLVCLASNERISQFFAMTPCRPNIGDKIESEDGIFCKVIDVVFRIVEDRPGIRRLVPNVFAEPVHSDDSQDMH